MTGRVRGLATLLESKTTTAKLIRVWCGLHQLDLVMQRVYKASLEGAFLATLTAAIGHLRRQQLLIAQMRSTCPKVADTRWLSMLKCTSWFTRNMIVIQEHYAARTPQHSTSPDTAWWVFLYAVHALALEANTAFTRLQGQQTLLSQQRKALTELADTYATITGMMGPLSDEEIRHLDEEDREMMEVCGGFALRYTNAEAFLTELDPWVESALAALQEEAKNELVASVAKLFVLAASGIREIVAERGSDNSAADEHLPSLPRELVSMKMPAFNTLLERHRPRLEIQLQASDIHQIGREFVELRRMYRVDESVRLAIDSSTATKTTFDDGWSLLGRQLPLLQQFCGDIATAFPNTATVESDFSVLGWEKDAYRQCLTDFSLEGILHAKQYLGLQRMSRVAQAGNGNKLGQPLSEVEGDNAPDSF